MSDETKKDGRFTLGFFLGGLLGAITMMVVGTKEGKKVQKDLKEKGNDIFNDLTGKLEELQEKGEDLIEAGENIKEAVETQLEEKKDVLSKEATKKIDSTLSHIEALQERGRHTTASIRKKFKNLPKKN